MNELAQLREENAKLRERVQELERIERLSNQLYTALRNNKPIPLGFRLCDEIQHLLNIKQKYEASEPGYLYGTDEPISYENR
jgi:hypothetical protein